MSQIELRKFVFKNGTKCIIRTAQESDAEKILNYLNKIVNDEDCFFILTPTEMEKHTVETEKEWVKKHQNSGSIAIVAEIDGDIVGLTSVVNSAAKRLRHIGVLGMSVLEQYRGLGLGSELMRTVLCWAQKDAVIEKVAFEVFATNSRAIKLYKKFGFIETGRKAKEFKTAPDKYFDSILMYKFVKSWLL
jgi:RimJ/RimL family protein N-acetyltransferase